MARTPRTWRLMVSRKAMRGCVFWVPIQGKLAVDQKLAGRLWESWDFPGFLVIRRKVMVMDLEDVMMSVLWLEMSAWSGAKSQVDG